MAWRDFTFQNPSSPFQQNFNYLAGINPDLAYNYAWNSGGRLNTQVTDSLKQALAAAGYNPNTVINEILGDGYAQRAVNIDPATGGSVNWGGQSYNLPQAIPTGMVPGWAGGWVMPSSQTSQGATPSQGSGGPLTSYGIGGTQTLNGFGIPGYETSPVTGGGSWEGTVWNGAPYSGLLENPLPETDVTNPNSPYYRPIYGGQQIATDEGTTTPGFAVNPAVPYQTSWYLQTYGGKAPPYINIHEQTAKSMQGIPAAKPGFNWASPQALAQLRGAGLPGGWTSILGFTPGGSNG